MGSRYIVCYQFWKKWPFWVGCLNENLTKDQIMTTTAEKWCFFKSKSKYLIIWYYSLFILLISLVFLTSNSTPLFHFAHVHLSTFSYSDHSYLYIFPSKTLYILFFYTDLIFYFGCSYGADPRFHLKLYNQ